MTSKAEKLVAVVGAAYSAISGGGGGSGVGDVVRLEYGILFLVFLPRKQENETTRISVQSSVFIGSLAIQHQQQQQQLEGGGGGAKEPLHLTYYVGVVRLSLVRNELSEICSRWPDDDKSRIARNGSAVGVRVL